MDINDFGIEKEYFGFSSGGYRQLQKSNTSFLNFTSIEETPEYQRALRKHQSVMEDLITDADKKAEVERFEAEVRNMRLQRGLTSVQTGLSTFNNVMAQLGFKPATTPTTNSVTNINSNQGGGGGGSKVPTWVWITGGLVVVGGVIFAIYKFRK